MERKRILIVDDETSLTRQLKVNLVQDALYEVRTEHRSVQALAAARVFRPHLIFLDLLMPQLGGEEIAAQIRADATLQQIPIVFLTAAVSASDLGNTGGLIDGHPVLPKPVTADAVIQCIEEQLQRG